MQPREAMNPLTDLDVRLVIGHRGNAAFAPENTLESFDQAVALGVDAIEFDVRLARDGVAMVMHDPTLERTAGRREPVASLTVSELRSADTGATFTRDGGRTFPYRGRGLTVPTLAEVLSRFPSVPMLIKVKVPEAAREVERAIEAAGATQRVVVASTARTRLDAHGVCSIAVSSALHSALVLRRPAARRETGAGGATCGRRHARVDYRRSAHRQAAMARWGSRHRHQRPRNHDQDAHGAR